MPCYDSNFLNNKLFYSENDLFMNGGYRQKRNVEKFKNRCFKAIRLKSYSFKSAMESATNEHEVL